MVNLQVIGTHISSLFNFVFRKRKKKRESNMFLSNLACQLSQNKIYRIVRQESEQQDKKRNQNAYF